ncbi:MAG: ferredoxin [bacterium]|nr:ferredoxin [bacterium]
MISFILNLFLLEDDVATWSIDIDRESCIGSGVCLVYAPNTFAHDDDAKAVVVDGATDDLESVQNAVQGCPTRALRLIVEEEV